MKLEDQFCSFEQGRKLSELIGIHKPIPLYCYYDYPGEEPFLSDWDGSSFNDARMTPAYTATEFLTLLPGEIEVDGMIFYLTIRKYKCGFAVLYRFEQPRTHTKPYRVLDLCGFSHGRGFPNILADMLFYLIENNFVKAEDLKL